MEPYPDIPGDDPPEDYWYAALSDEEDAWMDGYDSGITIAEDFTVDYTTYGPLSRRYVEGRDEAWHQT